MNKTLLSGMFSSISDAELVTELLAIANTVDDEDDNDENKEQVTKSMELEAERADNWQPNL